MIQCRMPAFLHCSVCRMARKGNTYQHRVVGRPAAAHGPFWRRSSPLTVIQVTFGLTLVPWPKFRNGAKRHLVSQPGDRAARIVRPRPFGLISRKPGTAHDSWTELGRCSSGSPRQLGNLRRCWRIELEARKGQSASFVVGKLLRRCTGNTPDLLRRRISPIAACA